MGQHVKVRVLSRESFAADVLLRDCTIGKVYDAYLPDHGEIDAHGLPTEVEDEVWFTDDVGDAVVACLSIGLEIVEEGV